MSTYHSIRIIPSKKKRVLFVKTARPFCLLFINVPPEMTPEALDARVNDLVNTNWEEVARTRMAEKGWNEVKLPEHLQKKMKWRFAPAVPEAV